VLVELTLELILELTVLPGKGSAFDYCKGVDD
jgi:hypothetical protein